ncbi:MAG: DUF1385 domain-containing protein, partial [candidate division NC10 bacterium]|nr:DUF1385 domain-containing protein [candidate division NC10 bacterium]
MRIWRKVYKILFLFSAEARLAVGGQAVIEGVMMRAPRSLTVAIRRPRGEVVVKRQDLRLLSDRLPFLKLPLLRGVIALGEALIYGISALNYSANQALVEEEDKQAELSPWALAGIMVFSLGVGIALFFILPLYLTHLISHSALSLGQSNLVFNLVDGVLRIAIFLLYVLLISTLGEVRRVFEYHGAEHVAIHAYEEGRSLVPHHLMGLSPLHRRCGTAFLLWVMVLSILAFSLIGREVSLGLKILSRILLLPAIAGVSYELIKLSGKGRYRLVDWLTSPGLWLQRMTTRKPREDQVEVAIRALQEVLEMEKEKEVASSGVPG